MWVVGALEAEAGLVRHAADVFDISVGQVVEEVAFNHDRGRAQPEGGPFVVDPLACQTECFAGVCEVLVELDDCCKVIGFFLGILDFLDSSPVVA